MKTKLRYKDIIDLEYFLHQDSNEESTVLHKRDRNIFLASSKNSNQGVEPEVHTLLLIWLKIRKAEQFSEPESKSPGDIFQDGQRLSATLAIVKGILAGFIAGWAFFTYTGTTPINVFHFLLLFVFSQVLFISLFLVSYLLKTAFPFLRLPSFYSLLLGGVVQKITSFVHRQWLQKAGGEKRASTQHALGIVKSRGGVYASLFYWPLFLITQLFGVGFNIGLITSTFLKISTSDLAFGWQSTIQFTTSAIYQLVQSIASPWAWFAGEGLGYPSLQEIEGSRIILKEGLYNLATADLIAWWPFLLFCLLFYGLLLRLFLYLYGKIAERRKLREFTFDTPNYLGLIRRMNTPLVSTQAAPELVKEPGEDPFTVKAEAPPTSALRIAGQIALIPDEIYEHCSIDSLNSYLHSHGLRVEEQYRFMVSYDRDRDLQKVIAEQSLKKEQDVCFLMEGWMVPLVSFLTYIKEMRELLPGNTIIYIVLTGKPGKTVFTPVSPQDLTIWQQKIEACGDPYIEIFPLIS